MRTFDRRRVLKGMGLGAVAAGFGGWVEAEGRDTADDNLASGAVIMGHPVVVTALPVKTPVATVWGGEVSGYRCGTGDRIAAFKGIPYGMDTRKTRFQAPRRTEGGWDNVLICTEWAQRAPQQSPDRGRPNPVNVGLDALQDVPVHYHLPPDVGVQSEDCLHVNVWTPGMHDRKKRRGAVLYPRRGL